MGGIRWGTKQSRRERCDAGKREVLSKGRGRRSWDLGEANQPGRQGQTSDQHARPVPGSGQLAAHSSELQGPRQKYRKPRTGEFCDWPAGWPLNQIWCLHTLCWDWSCWGILSLLFIQSIIHWIYCKMQPHLRPRLCTCRRVASTQSHVA